MKLHILQTIACPKCGQVGLECNDDVDTIADRIINGHVSCKNHHIWSVVEEVLRLDSEQSDEPMQLLDHDRTGFPQEVSEDERGDFLDAFEQHIRAISISDDEVLLVKGEPILFFKYLPSLGNEMVLVHQDEGSLRQMQEMIVRRQLYDSFSAVRATDLDLIGNYRILDFFPTQDEIKPNTSSFRFNGTGIPIWEGTNLSFVQVDH